MIFRGLKVLFSYLALPNFYLKLGLIIGNQLELKKKLIDGLAYREIFQVIKNRD